MLKVALYGNSLVMSSIGASLRERAEVRLLPMEGIQPDAAYALDAPDPDAIIFDLSAITADWAVELLKSHPTLLLIGIDLAANKAIVLSGQPTHFWTADDLVNLIASRTSGGMGLGPEACG